MIQRGLLLLLLFLLVSCQRGGSGAEELPTLVPASPTEDPLGGYPQEVLPTLEGVITDTAPLPDPAPPSTGEPAPVEEAPPAEAPPAEAPPAPARFSNLRFAPAGDAAAQANFPAGSEQVCAIWDYNGLTPEDTMRRVWYLNDAVYVERNEPWDYLKYSAAGTVTDICLYDRIDNYIDGAVDGIDPGQWRVEIYLGGDLLLNESFTVGGP